MSSRYGIARAAIGMIAAVAACILPWDGGIKTSRDTGVVSTAHAQSGPVCLSDIAAGAALSVSVVSRAPSQLCESAYRVIEIRNRSGVPLGSARLELIAPDLPDQMPFEPLDDSVEPPVFFEISIDDGATWRPVEAPRRVGDRLVWTEAEAPALARLGPNSAPDDSLLLRWRAPLGEAYGGAFAPEPAISVAGIAADACGAVAEAPMRETSLTTLKPAIVGRLLGRNASRGGQFVDVVPAAPGDLIEWRLEVDNEGDASAAAVRGEFTADGAALTGAERVDGEVGEAFAETGVIAVSPPPPGGRSSALMRMRAPSSCGRTPVVAELSYGCAAPSPGRVASIVADGAPARGWIVTEPDRTMIRVAPSVSGVDGQAAPAARAEIRVSVVNDGAAVFEPMLEIAPPDGYAIEAGTEVRFFATAAKAEGRVVGAVLDPLEGGSAQVRLVAEKGQTPILSPGDRVEIVLTAQRKRATIGETDEVSAALFYRDGCGAEGRTLSARARTALRQARLELELAPDGPPIVTVEGGEKTFVARVSNTGQAQAETVTILFEPGSAWRPAAPQGCAAEGGGARYRCVLEGPLASGETKEARFAFLLKPDLDLENDEGLAGGLRIDAGAVARAAGADGAPTGATLAQASASSSVIGFKIEQTLSTPGGEALDPARAIDLGQEIALDLEATWFGAEGRSLEDVAVALFLPPQLGFLEAETVDGDLEVVGLRAPRPGETGRLLWSLEAVDKVATVRLRARAIAIDSETEASQGALAASLSRGVVEADAIFSVDGESFGVDSTEEGPTDAAPLPLLFRRPDLRIGLTLKGAELETPTIAGAERRAAEEKWIAVPGRVLIAEARLRNLGAGPGYFDWLSLEVPKGVELLPFGSDNIDNDADGVVDEADEAAAVFLGETAGEGGARATEARWSGPSEAVGAGGRFIAPNEERIWRAALRIEPETAPGRRFPLKLEAQFGAQPVQSLAGGARRRAVARPVLATEAVSGWLVLTETSFGGDLSEIVRTGESAQHRLTMRLPPGPLRETVVMLDFDKAYAAPDRLEARFGAGVSCAGSSAAKLEDREEGGRRAVWRLGDCESNPEIAADRRVVILDVAAVVEDADPALEASERTAWRAPELVGRVSYVDRAEESGRAELILGASSLKVSGPSLRVIAGRPRRRGASEEGDFLLDAGDRFDGKLRVANVGDAPAYAAHVLYGWRAIAPPADASGFVCSALDVTLPSSGAKSERRWPCMIEASFDFSDDPLDPGEVVEMTLAGGLGPEAPIGGAVHAPIVALSPPPEIDQPFPEDGSAPSWLSSTAAPRGSADWKIELRPVPKPIIEVARGAEQLAIGDTFLSRGRFRTPEGRGALELVLRYRYEGRDGRPMLAQTPIAKPVQVTLSRSRRDIEASDNPSGMNGAAVGAPIALGEAYYRVQVGAEGWTEVVADLGDLSYREPSEGLGEGELILELAAEALNVDVANRGRRLVAVATLRSSSAEPTAEGGAWSSDPLVVAEIAEPFMDLAGLHEDVDGSVQLGERVVFIGRACNRGEGPAYGVSISGRLPSGFALDPKEPPSFNFDDGPEALGPRPYGTVSVDAQGVALGVARDATPIEVGACVALRLPTFVRSSASAEEAAEGLFSAPRAEAAFKIAEYRGRASPTKTGRVYSGLGTSVASVARRDLVLDAPSAAFLGSDGWIRHPFTVRLSDPSDRARLSLVLSDTDELTWTIFLDKNRDGRVDAGDSVWRDGAELPPQTGLAFVARARPKEIPPVGWRRTALLRAAAVAPDGRLLTGAREIVAARGSEEDGVMSAVRLMAVDRDCDGRLDDEAAQDAAFERAKDVAIGECVVMRVEFRNDGGSSVERVQIEDVVPDGARYLDTTATFASTPAGLVGRGIDLPEGSVEGRGRIRFRFVGALAPGLSGVVEYRIRITGA